MGNRAAKDELYAEFAEIGKAVASPRRVEILELLCQGEKTVETIAREIGQKVGNTSAHLRALRTARLVETRRAGPYVYYRTADREICTFLLALRRVAERRRAEVRETVRRYFTDPTGLEAIDREELRARVRRGEAVVIDVRPGDEYRAGHIPGARSVPPSELEEQLETLPRDQQIIAYCRGPYCMFSREAVALLRKRGFRAVRHDEGIMEWHAAGLPVAVGADPGTADWQGTEEGE